jgi:hypothetical protein
LFLAVAVKKIAIQDLITTIEDPEITRLDLELNLRRKRKMTQRSLPKYDHKTSDGCSVPKWLRWLILKETKSECVVCVIHDEAYYYGGSEWDRMEADEALLYGLVLAGMNPLLAFGYYLAVRIGGMPCFGVKNVSWSFGGNYFKYSSAPALPEE